MSEPYVVEARGVRKWFGSNEVLKSITLSVSRGEVLCLLGPSGSGKTTFLRCINHLESIDGGRILVNGELMGYRQRGDKVYELKPREIAEQRRSIGMVFQRFNLFPHMTALENITEAPIGIAKMPKNTARERGMALLDRVGLADKANQYPAQLSGGQQQRVAIARALVNDPALILADEPTGALDTATSVEVMALLQALNREGITIVVVTHENDIAAFAGRTILFRDGRVVSDVRQAPRAAAPAAAPPPAPGPRDDGRTAWRRRSP